MAGPGLRGILGRSVPRWLSNRPGLNVGFKILWAPAALLDVLLEGTVQGVRCWFPGYPVAPPGKAIVDVTTALPLAAQSRGLIQGEDETDEAFAARLVQFRATWRTMGSDATLVTLIQTYLGNTPTVRAVNRAGTWTSIAPDGTITVIQAGSAAWAWDWDSASNPERAGWWSDIWIVIEPCEWPITGTDLASLVGVWGTYGTAPGTGHGCDRTAVNAILSIVYQAKGAHTWVQAICWAYAGSDLFDPTIVNAGNPDGTWGSWSKYVSGVQVVARTGAGTGTARYWQPPGGG